MDINLKKITVRDVTKDYVDNAERGVLGYGCRLDIRPPYQREFIYKETQRNAVIDTITHEFPLNVMYWAVRDDGKFEIIDGQQGLFPFASTLRAFFHTIQNIFTIYRTTSKTKFLTTS